MKKFSGKHASLSYSFDNLAAKIPRTLCNGETTPSMVEVSIAFIYIAGKIPRTFCSGAYSDDALCSPDALDSHTMTNYLHERGESIFPVPD